MNDFPKRSRKYVRRLWGLCALACAAGLLPLPAAEPALTQDGRAVKLESFFHAHGCPAPHLVHEYLHAADENGIDYRLLPAVSVRESTCGLHARRNNRWGWDSARMGFASLARGIRFVAHELAFGRYYRGKTTDEKLRVYNPNPSYPKEVKRLMQEIDAD